MIAQFPEALQAEVMMPIGFYATLAAKPCRSTLTQNACPFARTRSAPLAFVVEKPLCATHLAANTFPATCSP